MSQRFIGGSLLVVGGTLLMVALLALGKSTSGSDEVVLDSAFSHLRYDDFQSGQYIELQAAPGIPSNISFDLVQSIQGHWRSDDLRFLVRYPDGSRPEEVLSLARSDDWGDALVVKEKDSLVSADCSWTPPADLDPGMQLEGWLLGEIVYPDAVPGGTFQNKHLSIELSFPIHMVSKDILVQNQRNFLSGSFKLLLLIAGPIALLGALLLVFDSQRENLSCWAQGIAACLFTLGAVAGFLWDYPLMGWILLGISVLIGFFLCRRFFGKKRNHNIA